MKAEEKIVAYVLFSCYEVCIFTGKKKRNLGGGGGDGEGQEQSRGTGGPNSSGR